MRVPNLTKALGRWRSLSLRQLADVTGRRGRVYLRAQAEEREAHRLGLHLDDPGLLPRAVPGTESLEEALSAIEDTAGRLPLATSTTPSPELLGLADLACAGLWDILGHRQVALGRTPDWHGDFVAGIHWDPSVPSRLQPIVRGDGSDIKIPWEISRLQHLPLVAQAFASTSEIRYRDLIALQLRDWISHNPVGVGVNWTCAMEVALRAVSMSWAFELMRRDPSVGQDLRARVLWSLFAHGHFIFGHLEDGAASPGNHYVADLLGLIWLGSLYPAFHEGTRWRDFGVERLLAHLPTQLNLDGGDMESSIGYHRLVFEMLGLALGILQANRQRAPELRDAVDRMEHFLESLQKPDGTSPMIGDDDGGHAFRSIAIPRAVEVTARACFPKSGLACFRDGDLYLAFAATPVGQHGQGGHGHNDKLSIELFHGGDLISDGGSFAYTSDPETRDSFRSTAAHATLQLDGREQNPIPSGDVFHLPERAHARILHCEADKNRFVCEGEHRGFTPFVHRRRVVVEGAQIIIVDSVLGQSSRVHELVIRFPLAPGLTPEILGPSVVVKRSGAKALALLASNVRWSIHPGWYAPTYGQRVTRQIVVARVQTRLPATVSFTLALPENPGRPAPTPRS